MRSLLASEFNLTLMHAPLASCLRSGWRRRSVQSVASFEDGDVVFSQPSRRLRLSTAAPSWNAAIGWNLELKEFSMRDRPLRPRHFTIRHWTRSRLAQYPLSLSPDQRVSTWVMWQTGGGCQRNAARLHQAAEPGVDGIRGLFLRRGQRLSAEGFSNPAEIFNNGFFQTGALQLAADFTLALRSAPFCAFLRTRLFCYRSLRAIRRL